MFVDYPHIEFCMLNGVICAFWHISPKGNISSLWRLQMKQYIYYYNNFVKHYFHSENESALIS